MKSTFKFIGLGVLLLAHGSWAGPGEPLAARREYLMGTITDLRVYGAPDRAAAGSALEAALEELRAVDRLMAVQRPDSDVSRLNRDGGHGPVPVDRRVIQALEASVIASRLTDGAFDVTVLPVVRAWGFTDGRPARPRPAAHHSVAGWRTLLIDAAAGTVAFRNPAAAVDLGGIGKGYGLDRARDVLRAAGVRSAWLDLGGQVATIGRAPDGGRWRIGIADPRHEGQLLGVVEIGEGSVSTSGDERQFVEEHGRRLGHIFDPRTGEPATGPGGRTVVSATVVSGSATTADALSTAAVVMGADRIVPILRRAGAEGVLAQLTATGLLTIMATPGAIFRPEPHDPEHPRVPDQFEEGG